MEMRLDLDQTGYNRFDLQKGEADFSHTHDHFQLSIPLSGKIQVHYNGKANILDLHEGFMVAPGDIHQHETIDNRQEILLISIREEILHKVFEHQTNQPLNSIDFQTKQIAPKKQLLDRVSKIYQIAAFEGADKAFELEEAFACLFLNQVIGSHSKTWEKYKNNRPFDESPIVSLIVEYIQANYHQEFSLDLLAIELKISKFHLHRSFTKAKGKTPMEYLHQIRLEKSKTAFISK